MSDTVYTCNRTQGVIVADGPSATITGTVSIPGAFIGALAVSPDKAFVYAAGDVNAKIEAASNTVVASVTTNISGNGSAVVSADGSLLFVTAVGGRRVFIYSTGTLAQVGFFDMVGSVTGPGFNSGITLSPDGSQLAIATFIGIEFFDAATFTRLGSYGGTYGFAFGAIYSPDGSHVYMLGTQHSPNQQLVDIVSTSTFLKTGSVNLGSTTNPPNINDGCFSPDGSTLWLNDNANTQIYQIQGGSVVSTTALTLGVVAMAGLQVSPDGTNLYFSDTQSLYRFNTGALAVQASGTNGRDYNLKVIGAPPMPPAAPTLNPASVACPPEIFLSW